MRSGDVIDGRYRLERPIGEGGLGVVWAARQLALDRPVAIKFLKHDPAGESGRRFAREAKVLASMAHPNLVAIFDVGETDAGEPFIVMEHLEGQSLDQLRGQRLPWSRAASIVKPILSGLIYAHQRGIVHRDLKPENVFLADDDGNEVVKVLDFGLAKLVGPQSADITKTGEVFGTPAYMSPEQLRGSRHVAASTDLYSLGVMLFELIEGRLPFTGSSMLEIGMAHVNDAPPSLTNQPQAVNNIVQRLLAKSPSDRYPNAESVIAALEHPRNLQTIGAPDEKNRPIALWAMIGLCLLIPVAMLVGRKDSGEPQIAPAPSEPALTAALVKTDAPQPPMDLGTLGDVDVEDQGVRDRGVEVDKLGSAGCGSEPPFSGKGNLHADSSPPMRVLTVVPVGYDPDRPHPVVVLLTQGGQHPKNILDDTGFARVAHANGFIVAAPQGEYYVPWREPDVERLGAVLEKLKSTLCVDEQRIFAVGQSQGAGLAERLACEVPGFAGIATHGYVGVPGRAWCERPIPKIHLIGLHDGYNPPAGGESCSDVDKISLADHEAHWRKNNGCRGPRKELLKYKTSTCYEWACDSEFVSCHLDGGHTWPQAGTRTGDAIRALITLSPPCDGKPADFPYAETVWDFFSRVKPRD